MATTLRAASIELMPTVDSTDNDQIYDVVGNKTDTIEGDSVISLLKIATDEVNVIKVEATVTGNGDTTLNAFKFTGNVLIISQEAIISEITDITTCSNAYATLYDGTNTINLTKNPGIDLSGVSLGSFFTKDKLASEPYTLNDASEVRLAEAGSTRTTGRPFVITGKHGVDNYIQFRFTGDANTNFKMALTFKYALLNGGTLELA